LLCETIGSRKATPISLLWCGGCHYDAMRPPASGAHA
jgi:hypothetical protein